jgi:NAD(P)H dehydrogenase (quinone)
VAKIAVVYYSKSGNTEKMAQLVAEGCRQVPGAEVEMVKLPELDMEIVLSADGYCLGSPDYFSYMAGHMKTFFDDALAYKGKLSGRPYVAFGTHGGGGKSLDSLERLSQALGLKQVRPGMMCANAPGPEDAEAVRGLGHALAEVAGR